MPTLMLGTSMAESKLQSKMIHFIKFMRGWVFKTLASSRNGTPDIIACIPLSQRRARELVEQGKTIGIFVAVEVKDTNKKAKGRELQEIQLKRIRDAGGIAFVSNDLEVLKETLRNEIL